MGRRGEIAFQRLRKKCQERNKGHCSLGEGPYCTDEKQDGTRRGNSIIREFRVGFSKNRGDLKGSWQMERERLQMLEAKVTIPGILP